jgi:hypothetical protein
MKTYEIITQALAAAVSEATEPLLARISELESTYYLMELNGGSWGEHPDYPVVDWQYEVANGDTRQGYWDWVENELVGVK